MTSYTGDTELYNGYTAETDLASMLNDAGINITTEQHKHRTGQEIKHDIT